MVAVKGLVLHHDSSRDSYLELTTHWAKEGLRRLGKVTMKASLTSDLERMQTQFVFDAQVIIEL